MSVILRPPGLELTVVAGLQEGCCVLRPSSQVGHRHPYSIPLAKACKMVNPDSRVGKLCLRLHGRSWESHLAKGEDTRRLFGTLFLPFWKTTVVFHKEVVRNLHFSNLSGSCNFSPLVWWFLKLPNHFWWGGILGPVLSFQMRSSSIDILLLLIHYL